LAATAYAKNVFINCPFDPLYAPVFDAIVFAVHDCGYVARCSLEIDDGAQVRLDRIYRVVEECRLGIHDISRTELDEAFGLPRFNMPLELGLFLGACRYGSPRQRAKICLILDRERYRYQRYISDLAGQDLKAHENDPKKAVRAVRDWLRNAAKASGDDRVMPGGSRMFDRYQVFLADLPAICDELGLDPEDLLYNDYTTLVVGWLREHKW
jgi:hypothetical protein